jgi:hypothetical protein
MTAGQRVEAGLAEELASALFGADVPQMRGRSRRASGPKRRNRKFQQALTDATERASVVGRFLPSQVVRGIAPPIAEAVLSNMAGDCDVELHGDKRVWVLGRDQRRATLSRLCEGPNRSQLTRLLDTAEPLQWDDTGRFLQAMLRGASVRIPPSLPHMRALAQACDWVSGVLDVTRQEQELRQAIAFRSLINEKSKLLKNGFFGRNDALEIFESFMRRDFSQYRPPVLAVSGIGGSGKTTFIAHVTRDLVQRREQGAPAVFEIDFDRFGLGPNSLIELTFEISRQIEIYDPALTNELVSLRVRMREDMARDLGTSTDLSYLQEMSLKFLGDVTKGLGRILAGTRWRRRDVLLVLDTFEELQAKRLDPNQPGSSGALAADQISVWIRQLVQNAELRRLRVLVSGRAPIPKDAQLHALVVNEITLTDLRSPDAVLVLQSEGLTPEASVQLQPLVGGNPLLLRIAARLIRRLKPWQRQAVLRDLARNPARVDAELVQGVLYDRILQHIRNDKARQLAHPGLVLRRVTWRLIKDVLAEPCQLGALDDDEAKRLLEALADEVWLVERDAQRADVLLHRSDIRRLMLRLMARDQAGPRRRRGAAHALASELRPPAEVARAIHERALAFYRQDPDDDMATAQSEAFYHRMMLVQDADAAGVTREDISRILATFGGDVDLLTPALRLRVRQLSGAPLALEDAALLPEDDWVSFAYREGVVRLDEQQDPLSALAILLQRPVGGPGDAPEWQLRALDAAVRWDEPSAEWLQDARAPRQLPRNIEENWGSHTATKSLLHWRRGEYGAAMVVTNGVLLEMRGAVSRMAPDQGLLAAHLRCANYALFARAAFDRAHPDRTGLLANPVQAEWPFDKLPSTVDHPALDVELRRYAALTWRPGTKLPFRLGLSAHAFVPDRTWLQEVAGLVGDSILPVVPLRDGASISDILSRSAGKFSNWMASAHRNGLFLSMPPDHFDAGLLCGTHPEMRPAARFALQQGFSTHYSLRRLAELSLPHLPIVPSDLQPDAFADPDRLPAHAISLLVEYADRSRVLAKVLSSAADNRPDCEPLRKVATSTSQWHWMFEETIAENRRRRRPSSADVDPNHRAVLPFIATAAAAPADESRRAWTDTDLKTRKGYDPHAYGTEIPAPSPSRELAARERPQLLRYTRFSILLSRTSRLPIYAAANISRETPWAFAQTINTAALAVQAKDPRVLQNEQPLVREGARFSFAITAEVLAYGNLEDAMQAIWDIRFAPNHIPSARTGIGSPDEPRERLWDRINGHVLQRAESARGVLFSGVAPRRQVRWKVVGAMQVLSGTQQGTRLLPVAFLVSTRSESSLIRQVPLSELEDMIGLGFGPLIDFGGTAVESHEITDLDEISLPR